MITICSQPDCQEEIDHNGDRAGYVRNDRILHAIDIGGEGIAHDTCNQCKQQIENHYKAQVGQKVKA